MIGVDIVKISRFEADFDGFIKTVLTENERNEILKRQSRKVRLEYLAGRFAAKEAFVKATGKKEASYLKDIEIIDDESGKPHLFYLDKEVGEITISHDEYAVAVVSIGRLD